MTLDMKPESGFLNLDVFLWFYGVLQALYELGVTPQGLFFRRKTCPQKFGTCPFGILSFWVRFRVPGGSISIFLSFIVGFKSDRYRVEPISGFPYTPTWFKAWFLIFRLKGHLSLTVGRNSIEFAAEIVPNGWIWRWKWCPNQDSWIWMFFCDSVVFYKHFYKHFMS